MSVRRDRRHLAWFCAVFLGALLWATSAGAQYGTFGKNKVTYREFEWQILRSDHFELYFYPEEEDLARLTLASAERSYQRHRAAFLHEVEGPIPIILYSSHHDFQQTNITSMFLPEGVGGLTDHMRGRVLMPFTGSYHQFFGTLEHELVHAFQLSLNASLSRDRNRSRRAAVPLWFTEGLADHWSSEWDADGDMVLRDLVIRGNLPAINEFWRYDGTFTVYKLGQSVLDFVEENYGDDKLTNFYTDLWKARNFEDLFLHVIGITQEELSSRWMQAVRERYYPDVLRAEPLLHNARKVSKYGAELKPTPVPEGVEGYENAYVFISSRGGYTNIYAASLAGEEYEMRTLLKGQRNPEYLSFHSYKSRLDISARGMLVFSTHAGDRDALVIFDLRRKRVVNRWRHDPLVGMASPQWDLPGERIVFSGLARQGQRDIYLLDTGTNRLEQLTDDLFNDTEPTFHPDGDRVLFVSDRCEHGQDGATNLFELDLETGVVEQITGGHWRDLSPSWSPDGEQLLFVSTRDGLRNLYTIDADGNRWQLTCSLEAILDPRWLPSGDEILASMYREGRLLAVVIPAVPIGDPLGPIGDAATESVVAADAQLREWTWETSLDSIPAQPAKYRSRFSLDAAVGGIAVSPGYGGGEALQVLLRDMLGNKAIMFQLANTTISTHAFFDNFSAGVTYIDLSRRINRGISLYHHAGTYYDARNVPFFERRAGFGYLLSYPLSRFTRLETNLGLAWRDKEKPWGSAPRKGMLGIHNISWVHDTSLWLPTGPIDGARHRVTLGLTMDFHRPGLENFLAVVDLRRYVRLGTRSALALRFQGRASGGPDPQVFLLGGAHSLRGYPWRSLAGTRAVLGNVELRFPLLRGLFLVPEGLGPLGFPGVQGALFIDTGQAWDDFWPTYWLGSYGVGLRMSLGGAMVFRLDFARRMNYDYWPSKTYTEFFIGWNY